MINIYIINITIKRIFKVLIAVVIFLIIMNLAAQILKFYCNRPYALGFVPKFDFDAEANIPTYYSVFLLLLAALLTASIGFCKKAIHDKFANHWIVLSILFVMLSLDELSALHELLSVYIKMLTDVGGIFYFAWILIAFPLIVIFLLAYWKFFWSFSTLYKRYIILAGAIYLSAVFLMELLGGWYASQHGMENFAYNMLATIEETMEFCGLLVFIYALMHFIANRIPYISFRLKL